MSDKEAGERVTAILNLTHGASRAKFKSERAELVKLLNENQGGAATKAWAHWVFERNRKKHAAERVFDEARKIIEGRCDDVPSDDLFEFADWIVRWLRPTMPAAPRQRRPRKLPSNVIPFRRPAKVAGAQASEVRAGVPQKTAGEKGCAFGLLWRSIGGADDSFGT
jgi:hypothetical protein